MHFDLGQIDWSAIAAIATAILAVMTWLLARSTRALAASTEEVARETTNDVAAAFRPALIVQAPEVEGTYYLDHKGREGVVLNLMVSNAGHGPAMNCSAQASCRSTRWNDEDREHVPDGPPNRLMERQAFRPILAGDSSQVGISFWSNVPVETGTPQHVEVTLSYVDIAQASHHTVITHQLNLGVATKEQQTFSSYLLDIKTE